MNTTRRRRARLAGALLGTLLLADARAQTSASTSANLVFGRFAAGSGGAILVDPNSVRSRSGGVVLLSGEVSAASFSLVDRSPKNANRVFIVTLPANGSVTMSNGSSSMAVNDFVSLPSGSGVLVGGRKVITVGASLQVTPSQPPGNYTGTMQITLEYQ